MAWPDWPWPAVFHDRSTPMNVATFALPLRGTYLAKMIFPLRRILPYSASSRGWNPYSNLCVSVSPTVTVTRQVVYRDGKELKLDINEPNENPVSAKNRTEPERESKKKYARTRTEQKPNPNITVLTRFFTEWIYKGIHTFHSKRGISLYLGKPRSSTNQPNDN